MNETKLKRIVYSFFIIESVLMTKITSSLMDSDWDMYDTASLILLIIFFLLALVYIMKQNKSKKQV
ncbi:MAG: hypothetical protein RSC93_10155 [Erysipelotrichaceae bacterium]